MTSTPDQMKNIEVRKNQKLRMEAKSPTTESADPSILRFIRQESAMGTPTDASSPGGNDTDRSDDEDGPSGKKESHWAEFIKYSGPDDPLGTKAGSAAGSPRLANTGTINRQKTTSSTASVPIIPTIPRAQTPGSPHVSLKSPQQSQNQRTSEYTTYLPTQRLSISETRWRDIANELGTSPARARALSIPSVSSSPNASAPIFVKSQSTNDISREGMSELNVEKMLEQVLRKTGGSMASLPTRSEMGSDSMVSSPISASSGGDLQRTMSPDGTIPHHQPRNRMRKVESLSTLATPRLNSNLNFSDNEDDMDSEMTQTYRTPSGVVPSRSPTHMYHGTREVIPVPRVITDSSQLPPVPEKDMKKKRKTNALRLFSLGGSKNKAASTSQLASVGVPAPSTIISSPTPPAGRRVSSSSNTLAAGGPSGLSERTISQSSIAGLGGPAMANASGASVNAGPKSGAAKYTMIQIPYDAKHTKTSTLTAGGQPNISGTTAPTPNTSALPSRTSTTSPPPSEILSRNVTAASTRSNNSKSGVPEEEVIPFRRAMSHPGIWDGVGSAIGLPVPPVPKLPAKYSLEKPQKDSGAGGSGDVEGKIAADLAPSSSGHVRQSSTASGVGHVRESSTASGMGHVRKLSIASGAGHARELSTASAMDQVREPFITDPVYDSPVMSDTSAPVPPKLEISELPQQQPAEPIAEDTEKSAILPSPTITAPVIEPPIEPTLTEPTADEPITESDDAEMVPTTDLNDMEPERVESSVLGMAPTLQLNHETKVAEPDVGRDVAEPNVGQNETTSDLIDPEMTEPVGPKVFGIAPTLQWNGDRESIQPDVSHTEPEADMNTDHVTNNEPSSSEAVQEQPESTRPSITQPPLPPLNDDGLQPSARDSTVTPSPNLSTVQQQTRHLLEAATFPSVPATAATKEFISRPIISPILASILHHLALLDPSFSDLLSQPATASFTQQLTSPHGLGATFPSPPPSPDRHPQNEEYVKVAASGDGHPKETTGYRDSSCQTIHDVLVAQNLNLDPPTAGEYIQASVSCPTCLATTQQDTTRFCRSVVDEIVAESMGADAPTGALSISERQELEMCRARVLVLEHWLEMVAGAAVTAALRRNQETTRVTSQYHPESTFSEDDEPEPSHDQKALPPLDPTYPASSTFDEPLILVNKKSTATFMTASEGLETGESIYEMAVSHFQEGANLTTGDFGHVENNEEDVHPPPTKIFVDDHLPTLDHAASILLPPTPIRRLSSSPIPIDSSADHIPALVTTRSSTTTKSNAELMSFFETLDQEIASSWPASPGPSDAVHELPVHELATAIEEQVEDEEEEADAVPVGNPSFSQAQTSSRRSSLHIKPKSLFHATDESRNSVSSLASFIHPEFTPRASFSGSSTHSMSEDGPPTSPGPRKPSMALSERLSVTSGFYPVPGLVTSGTPYSSEGSMVDLGLTLGSASPVNVSRRGTTNKEFDHTQDAAASSSSPPQPQLEIPAALAPRPPINPTLRSGSSPTQSATVTSPLSVSPTQQQSKLPPRPLLRTPSALADRVKIFEPQQQKQSNLPAPVSIPSPSTPSSPSPYMHSPAASEDALQSASRPSSPYHTFMKSEMSRIKSETPNAGHKEAFKLAAYRWKTSPENPKNMRL
ncbi:hypothetical protein DFS34DRAFT_638730 [Phlyctochytrium arcticum]|nr:hypothetical protein DFS34DRAFT_638730 [Phlyctochytrium arcticum]